jgi:hypothetical protein
MILLPIICSAGSPHRDQLPCVSDSGSGSKVGPLASPSAGLGGHRSSPRDPCLVRGLPPQTTQDEGRRLAGLTSERVRSNNTDQSDHQAGRRQRVLPGGQTQTSKSELIVVSAAGPVDESRGSLSHGTGVRIAGLVTCAIVLDFGRIHQGSGMV